MPDTSVTETCGGLRRRHQSTARGLGVQLSRRPFIGEVANDFSWRIVAIGYHVGSSNRAISHSAGKWSSSQLIAANFLCYDLTDDFRCPPPNGVRWVERRRDLRGRRAQHTGRLGGHFLAVLQQSDTPYRRCLQPVPRQTVGRRDFDNCWNALERCAGGVPQKVQ